MNNWEKLKKAIKESSCDLVYRVDSVGDAMDYIESKVFNDGLDYVLELMEQIETDTFEE